MYTFRQCICLFTTPLRSWREICTILLGVTGENLIRLIRIGFDRMLGLIPYGSVFRKLRRLVHKELGNSAAQAYQPYQEHASRNLIHDLILRQGLDIDLLRQ
jgi:cytochrome P450